MANWSQLALPRMVAPAALSLATLVASNDGTYESSTVDPAVVRRPAVQMVSCVQPRFHSHRQHKTESKLLSKQRREVYLNGQGNARKRWQGGSRCYQLIHLGCLLQRCIAVQGEEALDVRLRLLQALNVALRDLCCTALLGSQVALNASDEGLLLGRRSSRRKTFVLGKPGAAVSWLPAAREASTISRLLRRPGARCTVRGLMRTCKGYPGGNS